MPTPSRPDQIQMPTRCWRGTCWLEKEEEEEELHLRGLALEFFGLLSLWVRTSRNSGVHFHLVGQHESWARAQKLLLSSNLAARRKVRSSAAWAVIPYKTKCPDLFGRFLFWSWKRSEMKFNTSYVFLVCQDEIVLYNIWTKTVTLSIHYIHGKKSYLAIAWKFMDWAWSDSVDSVRGSPHSPRAAKDRILAWRSIGKK